MFGNNLKAKFNGTISVARNRHSFGSLHITPAAVEEKLSARLSGAEAF